MSVEEQKLKTKINRLNDEIYKINSDISVKKAMRKSLEKEVKMLQSRENSSDIFYSNLEKNYDNDIVAFLKDFCVIAKMIFENNDYIPYNYKTQNSEYFYKIEKSVFDDYIAKYAGKDIKTFLNYCITYGLVKSDKNRKCTYNAGTCTVYYVSKAFMEAAESKVFLEGAS